MRKLIFLTLLFFGSAWLFAGDAWNQPQIDKAKTFQRLFNGEERSDTSGEIDSGTNTSMYIAMGAIVVVFTLALGFVIRSRNEAKKNKMTADTDEEYT
jgi:heme/copper-type cytochrome/quinol oxidase subunit 2